MKLARLFLAVLTISTLAACSDSVTAPQTEPAATPSTDEIACDLVTGADGSQFCRGAVIGSGG
jgi:hypothetical protein